MKRYYFLLKSCRLIINLVIIILLYSCNTKSRNQERGSENQELRFKKIGEKKFPLDSLTSKFGNMFQYLDGNQNEYFIYLNSSNNNILFYNYNTTELEFSIKMDKSGPNGVGNLTGFLASSIDSIFIYSYNTASLHLINKSGEILNKYNLSGAEFKYQNRPFVSIANPIVKIGDKIFLNSFGSRNEYSKNNDKKEKLILELDLNTKNKKYFFEYPDIYGTGIWGTTLHLMYNSYNPHKKEYIISFPIDNDIYVVNNDHNTNKYLAKASFVNTIEPLSKSTKISAPPPIEEAYVVRSQPNYSSIHFNPYSHQCYRIAYRSISEVDFYSGDFLKSRFREASLIVMDERYSYIGQIDMEKYKYIPDYQFYNENGIHILKLDLNDEDNLTFDILKIVKNE